MNRENTILGTIIILALAAALFTGSADFRGPSEPGGWSYDRVLDSKEQKINLTVELNDPQPDGNHWSLYVIVEEWNGTDWEKTTRNITAYLIRYNNSEPENILELHCYDGTGFVEMNISYDLPEGNYTVKAGVNIDGEMVWEKRIIHLPLSSRPPHAVASLILNNVRMKEANLTLDRQHRAGIILDASETTDPDPADAGRLNYTWLIGDTIITINKETLLWTFNESGDYIIRLRVLDPERMYDEDYVTVHVRDGVYLPDLRVSVDTKREEIEAGERVLVRSVIFNTGTENTGGFDVYYYDWVGNARSLFRFEHVGNVLMGMNRTISFYYTPTLTGEHRIQAVVDPFNSIHESNEDNNDGYCAFRVEPPLTTNVFISAFGYNGSLHVNEITNISVVIQNNNSRDVKDVTAYLYINGESMLVETFGSIPANGTASLTYAWTPHTPGTYTVHIELWVNSSVMDHRYLRGMEVVETSSSAQQKDPPVLLYTTAGGITAIALLGIVGVVGYEDMRYRLFSSLLATPLYTRLKREDTLNNETRERVYNHIIANPGDSYASILKKLELKNGTLVYHLRTLEREHYIKSKKDGKFKRFYPWGHKVGARDPNHLTNIQNEIVNIIKSNPGVSQSSIANMLGRSRQSVNYQIKVMAEAGLINVVKHGITSRCYMKET